MGHNNHKIFKKALIASVAVLLNFLMRLFRGFKPAGRGIYFCYNQSIHQIYHSLFVAIELSNLQSQADVCVLSTSEEASGIIEDELAAIPHRVKFRKINHRGYYKTDFNVNWFVFHCFVRMFRPLSVIVTDYFDNVFRQLGLKTFWVFLGHGILNRAFSFDEHLKDYDLVVLAGEKDLQGVREKVGPLDNVIVGGYSKLDYFHYHRIRPRILFKDTKPVILYNPHFEESLSSFFDSGRGLLEAFSRDGRWNVIFMPHPDLSRRYPRLIEPLGALPGVVLINRPKINLDYMATSDIYITDISSSVFEWFYFNKPVIFFDTKKVDWKTNPYYKSWSAGLVAEDLPGVVEAVENALKHPEEYREERRRLFEGAFYRPERTVSKDIAQAISQRLFL